MKDTKEIINRLTNNSAQISKDNNINQYLNTRYNAGIDDGEQISDFCDLVSEDGVGSIDCESFEMSIDDINAFFKWRCGKLIEGYTNRTIDYLKQIDNGDIKGVDFKMKVDVKDLEAYKSKIANIYNTAKNTIEIIDNLTEIMSQHID